MRIVRGRPSSTPRASVRLGGIGEPQAAATPPSVNGRAHVLSRRLVVDGLGVHAWVVGEEPYVSLHFLGADEYASPEAEASGGETLAGR